MNKKILNSLLLDKITRRIDTEEGKQAKANASSKDQETSHIFTEEAKLLKMKTLNNFKGLSEYFKHPASYIDYDKVLSQVLIFILL
jgi:hypothetical protein